MNNLFVPNSWQMSLIISGCGYLPSATDQQTSELNPYLVQCCQVCHYMIEPVTAYTSHHQHVLNLPRIINKKMN